MYLFLSTPLYTNNYILIADIGERIAGRTGEPLLCYTDNTQCCNSTSMNMGDWSLPDGTKVGGENDGGDFYISRGLSVVRLHRRNNATSPTGMFCCEVPNARSVNIRTCIDIGRLFAICVNDFYMPLLLLVVLQPPTTPSGEFSPSIYC